MFSWEHINPVEIYAYLWYALLHTYTHMYMKAHMYFSNVFYTVKFVGCTFAGTNKTVKK